MLTEEEQVLLDFLREKGFIPRATVIVIHTMFTSYERGDGYAYHAGNGGNVCILDGIGYGDGANWMNTRNEGTGNGDGVGTAEGGGYGDLQ